MADTELTTKQSGKIRRAVKALNDVRRELQNDNPDKDIQWYLEGSDNLNLMEGESHSDRFNTANQDAVIELFQLDCSSGGGW